MQHGIYTVYDVKAEAYLPPFFLQTDAVAKREFRKAANNPEHAFCVNAEDYTLFKIGTWSDVTAEMTPHPPKSLGVALEYLARTTDTEQNVLPFGEANNE